MARAQSQYLRIYDIAGTTYQRWQSYYANTSVTWASAQWLYVPFIADGLTAGISGDESSITITAPANTIVMDAFELAIRAGRMMDLSIYQFDAAVNNDTPVSTQELIAQFTGQVVGGSGGLTSITIQLGNALSPVGAQIPPRKFTSSMIGKGAKL